MSIIARKLFCELSPLTYRVSTCKEIALRRLRDVPLRSRFAREQSPDLLPVRVYRHSSLIRRRLGEVDMALQDNKAVNLGLAAPRIDHLLIRPGEIFSFWHRVGDPTAAKGYREGLVIASGATGKGMGGGMCQFTNLIHWMVLHSELTITERHHHDGVDLFPDFGRVIPFGTGTSILYNYLDYRFRNDTDATYQLVTYTTSDYLHGELRCDRKPSRSFHIRCRDEFFSREADGVYRNNQIYRVTVDNATGQTLAQERIAWNHAKIAYDPEGLEVVDMTT